MRDKRIYLLNIPFILSDIFIFAWIAVPEGAYCLLSSRASNWY